ncbi:unnamed protein product [Trichogramma brassicae]|uniref:RNA-directed DNA polymerase n=1 Tax=Trichogramma brassicae TaxID=86971 RepID=A0A6H5IQN0_9HYME|nr:unnamed protein product [Trichogramma brassicae]
MGGALEQQVEGTWRPLAFFSRKFNPAQARYSTFDRELTAMAESVKYFDYYLEGRRFTLVTDHKPLIYAHNQSHDKAPPRRLRQLIYLAQFEVNYEYLPGKSNEVADSLSRIESAPAKPVDDLASFEFPLSIDSITIPPRIDLPDIVSTQNEDAELSDILKDPSHKLKLKTIPLGPENLKVYCESREGVNRPYLPASLRKESFSLYHGDAHPSARAMKRRVKEHFVWPNMDRDIARWCKSCINCQLAKVGRHTSPMPLHFDTPDARFDHVHIDIVGPLPVSDGYRYLLTMIDRYTRWPEAVPMRDIRAETVANEFRKCWIARFGSPITITTDQGKQFESAVFSELLRILGIKRCRTTSYHPCGNGMIERWHRSLKAAIMCHAKSKIWTELLPSVMLGLRTRLLSSCDASPADMLYGSPLRIPGDLCVNPDAEIDPKIFLNKFRAHMSQVRPVPVTHKTNRNAFVTADLNTCSHVLKVVRRVKSPLVPPYTGPHKVLSRDPAFNTFKIDINGREVVVSIDRLKPAHFVPSVDAALPRKEKLVPNILRKRRAKKCESGNV